MLVPTSDRFFDQLRPLGSMTDNDGPKCSANVSYGTGGKRISAYCDARAEFEHGKAEIVLLLVQHDGAWQIAGLHVNPQLASGSPDA